MSTIKSPKKLIEVALPLDDINAAAAREKSIRHGHPSTLHLWWARRPLAAARAVLFAQMVNDPGGERGWFTGKSKAQADAEREKLFDIIRDLVKWENTNNEAVLERARAEIRKSWRETCEMNKGKAGFDPEKLPAFHDPFAGGGAIPLEAQRLGLEAHASDLNPVAVLINKAMIEIPPKFAGRPPVGPTPTGEKQTQMHEDWSGARGLAEDVRRYGHWMREEAEKRIGHLYPKVEITADIIAERPDLEPLLGQRKTVIAWIWARTVKSPNPAFSESYVPLASSFVLSTKKGKQTWAEPIIDGKDYHFRVRHGVPPERAKNGTKLGRGASFQCIFSGAPIDKKYVRKQFREKSAGQRLMAIVVEGARGRIYLSPIAKHEEIAIKAQPSWKPDVEMNQDSKDLLSGRGYGFKYWSELFTSRQLVALTTFFDLVAETRNKVIADATVKGRGIAPCASKEAQARFAEAYSDAIALFLAFSIDKGANLWSTITSWMSDRGAFRETFARQAIPMVWDYAESNPFSNSGGNIATALDKIRMAIEWLPARGEGAAHQEDAAIDGTSTNCVISTDPPYYDNISYADLSDYFYVWLRRALRDVFPGLFATMAVPKSEELIAAAYRHGGKHKAEQFFLEGMKRAITILSEKSHPGFPVSIYYAFKQSKNDGIGISNSGWSTFLEAVVHAGFSITGTWPVRTEGAGRIIATGRNALASSIVLICRKRDLSAGSITRRDFQRQLREQMPESLETMIGGAIGRSPIAPVDLAQAAIGPGMAIFSKHEAVLNQDGSYMGVHDALILINRAISDFLTPDAGDFDADTLFCNSWFEQYAWSAGSFGDADVLARGKGTSVDGVRESGVVESGGGKVRLLRWRECTIRSVNWPEPER